MRTPCQLKSHIAPLLDVAATLGAAERPKIEALCDTLLAWETATRSDCRGGRSSLNSDGSPLQLCLSGSNSGWRGRLLGDPASLLANPVERAHASRPALEASLSHTRSEALAPLCRATWSLLLPADDEGLERHVEGVIWLGGGIGTPGLAVYFDATRGTEDERWTRVDHWLAELVHAPGFARATLSTLRSSADLMCAGLEGTEPSNARAKVYWRLRAPTPLSASGIELLSDSRMLEWLSMTLGDFAVSPIGIVFSVGFSVRTGDLLDAKIDLCCHCIPVGLDRWQALFVRYTARFGLAPLDLRMLQLERGTALSYVGFGLDRDRTSRINLYLRAAENELHNV